MLCFDTGAFHLRYNWQSYTNSACKDQKEGFCHTVVEALLKTGFNEDGITKISGGNFCRIFDTATAGP
jgi:microsomal dipeptidase-like Zn-dependent dipeptidase